MKVVEKKFLTPYVINAPIILEYYSLLYVYLENDWIISLFREINFNDSLLRLDIFNNLNKDELNLIYDVYFYKCQEEFYTDFEAICLERESSLSTEDSYIDFYSASSSDMDCQIASLYEESHTVYYMGWDRLEENEYFFYLNQIPKTPH